MENIDNNEEEYRRSRRENRRGSGYSATVAAAVLVFFGAMSRLGKTPELPTFLELDNQAKRRIQLEEERLRAVQVIGPAFPENDAIAGPAGGREQPVGLPPFRDGLDSESLPLSAAQRRLDNVSEPPEDVLDVSRAESGDGRQTPVRPAAADQSETGRPSRYQVTRGDTWAKIAQRFLGDQNRWREIMDANPAARNGLKIGMLLILP
ncbi:MAG: LysM peptidoglycan-binding domain-containing protein [Planctomycetota bacterium]|jgi:hypothetical protein|nr:LysM peptidoglycan-binding domain-containing protein [Planctomycetota bacterium]